MDIPGTLQRVKEALAEVPEVTSARAYGSSLYRSDTADVDVAVTVPSTDGCIEPMMYRRLHELRQSIARAFSCDLDLVPHTDDEWTDRNSPIWDPRHNPALCFGITLKGDFPISPSTLMNARDSVGNSIYILYDNRTVCRRQLVRSLDGEYGRIFCSKLLHGPGNGLSVYAFRVREPYPCCPSDFERSFVVFDAIFGTDSANASEYLRSAKKNLNFDRALRLMEWYEKLMNVVRVGDANSKDAYNRVCETLS